jgi:ATP-dependent RNA helicase RhlE
LHALVLDEADQMLDMGFVNDVKKNQSLPKKQTNTLFSATMPIAIRTG